MYNRDIPMRLYWKEEQEARRVCETLTLSQALLDQGENAPAYIMDFGAEYRVLRLFHTVEGFHKVRSATMIRSTYLHPNGVPG